MEKSEQLKLIALPLKKRGRTLADPFGRAKQTKIMEDVGILPGRPHRQCATRGIPEEIKLESGHVLKRGLPLKIQVAPVSQTACLSRKVFKPMGVIMKKIRQRCLAAKKAERRMTRNIVNPPHQKKVAAANTNPSHPFQSKNRQILLASTL